MYGYRYTPTSPPFPLPGRTLDEAADDVARRRHTQTMNGSPATVELVEQTDDGWQLVLQPAAPATPPQARHTLPVDGDPVTAVLADLATLPRRTGRKRKRR